MPTRRTPEPDDLGAQVHQRGMSGLSYGHAELGHFPQAVRVHPQVTRVLHRKSRRLNEFRELPLRHDPDVLDYLLWRADFGVAVVPGKLQELQEIECRSCILPEQFTSSGCPRSSPIPPTDHHGDHSVTRERQVGGTLVNVRIKQNRAQRGIMWVIGVKGFMMLRCR